MKEVSSSMIFHVDKISKCVGLILFLQHSEYVYGCIEGQYLAHAHVHGSQDDVHRVHHRVPKST